MPEMKDLIAIFRAETEEHLTQLDTGLVELERGGRTKQAHLCDLSGHARRFGQRSDKKLPVVGPAERKGV